MKTLHLSIIAIFLIGISFVISGNVSAICTGYCPAIPWKPYVPPSLASINVTFNANTNSPVVITGTVYKLFSPNIVLTVFNPQRQLIVVSQLQPALDGSFSESLVTSNPLWSTQGNYTARISSDSQNLTETTFYFPGTGCCKAVSITSISHKGASPQEQLRSGIAANDVKCNTNLVLVIKSEDGSPACVKPDTATNLVVRGWAKDHTGVSALGNPSVQLFNVTTSPQPIILGIPFYVDAIVVNHQTDPITYYGGCVYPLSVSFDNIKTYTNNIHCLAISKNVLGPNEQAIIHSERIGTLYNVTGPDATTATIKFSYEVNGNQTSFFTSKQFSIQHEQALPDKSGEKNKTNPTLSLYLSADSYANPAEAVVVDISLNNTGSTPLILAKSDNWPRNDLSSGPCSNLPFGMAILKGYYTEQNLTGASSLVIYGTVPCPLPPLIKSYTFQPLSSKATQECDSLFSCPELSDMKIHLKIDGFMDNNGQHRSFNVGTYTIVGGDEWGHVAIQHFTEAYATALAGVK